MEAGDDEHSIGSINLMLKESVPNITNEVHQLPCCIKYDGDACVSHYFKPKPTGVEMDGLKLEEASFRGRKLQGTTIPIPQGYSGLVLGKKSLGNGMRKACDSSEGKGCNWEVKATFEKMTYWNHDSQPSRNDAFLRSFHCLSVAKALHKPVTAEEMVSASIALKKAGE
ncbi:uncharacterized protein C12B10.15c-like [Rutidosis leptorrhynchoides]|uniref:uncharacterized protein C12B10.15c-like n=1 Tax=Rutidosis leptorrhynchoides TaxID=125765 RepID=UPI003A9955C4